MLDWLFGKSGSTSATTGDNSSPLFAYGLLAAVVLLIIAVIFGELETA